MIRYLARIVSSLIVTVLFVQGSHSVSARSPAQSAVGLRGLWLTSRKDPRNQARADVYGRFSGPPREIWRIATGGEVGFVRPVTVAGRQFALVHAGTTLQLLHWTGKPVWQDLTSGVTLVMRVADFDHDGRLEVLTRTNPRTVVLFDVATGRKLWTWQCEPSTQILGVAFLETSSGVRFICFPSYSTNGYCFDFSDSLSQPRLVWSRDYEGKYGAGYGPSIVLKDMDKDGRQEVVLSGKIPSVYQAVINAETGEIEVEQHYSVGEQWGRPYGLLQASDLDSDGYPDLVMISCQVEEYIAVARNLEGKRIEKAWDKFVEKDWPEDHKELRPQITSVADLQGNGKPELVIGLWEQDQWRTLVIADPLRGFTATRGNLAGYYFWGCYDITSDGRPEIIVSKEAKRRPSRVTTLLALDGRTLRPLATLANASIFGSADSPLPHDIAFMALRNNPVCLRNANGRSGILVRKYRLGKESGVYLWGADNGEPIRTCRIAGPGFTRVDAFDRGFCLSDPSGKIVRFDMRLTQVGDPLHVYGRIAQPLVWEVDGKRQIVFDAAGARIVGGTPDLRRQGRLDGQWTVSGIMPALHIDSSGRARLSAADVSDPDHYAALVYHITAAGPGSPQRIPLSHPPYLGLTPFGSDFRLVVNLQTGVHTMALACYDSGAKLIWEDKAKGAHPRIPGAADLDGDGREEVIADDHGVLRVYGSSGEIIGMDPGWPPAYTLPISIASSQSGQMDILRASGIGGTSLVGRDARELWKVTCDTWRYYRCLGAVGDANGDGRLELGILAEDGVFECTDLITGKLIWTLQIREPSNTSVVAGDLNDDGKDEFLFGLDDGELFCVGESDGKGAVLWRLRLGAGVANPIIADLDGDNAAEVVVSTSDGYLRVLR